MNFLLKVYQIIEPVAPAERRPSFKYPGICCKNLIL